MSASYLSPQALAEATEAAKREVEARIQGIYGHESAKALPALAHHLAFKTDLTVSEAREIFAHAMADRRKAIN
ncbi:MAG: hypothetical protein O9342_00205 [Beijerinckiaceae bacterium]|nr:hypothetical protein [Beijerinckiaceae bacterium]